MSRRIEYRYMQRCPVHPSSERQTGQKQSQSIELAVFQIDTRFEDTILYCIKNILIVRYCIEKIIHAVKTTLEKTPPELSADVMNRGIVLTGGGAMLKNIDKVISEETNIPVFIADEPLESVAIGTGKSLDYIQHFRENPNVATRITLD